MSAVKENLAFEIEPILPNVLRKKDIVNNSTTGGIDKVASAEALRILNQKVDASAGTSGRSRGVVMNAYTSQGNAFQITNIVLLNGGQNYLAGDAVFILAGNSMINAIVIINTVSENGTITTFELSKPGNFKDNITGIVTAKGGHGNGAQFNIECSPQPYLTLLDIEEPVGGDFATVQSDEFHNDESWQWVYADYNGDGIFNWVPNVPLQKERDFFIKPIVTDEVDNYAVSKIKLSQELQLSLNDLEDKKHEHTNKQYLDTIDSSNLIGRKIVVTTDDGKLKSSSVPSDDLQCLINSNYQSPNIVMASGNGTGSGGMTFRKLVAADIPALDASKITSGLLPLSRGGLGDFIGQKNLIIQTDWTGTLGGSPSISPSQVPNLDASKITSGTFDVARIPIVPLYEHNILTTANTRHAGITIINTTATAFTSASLAQYLYINGFRAESTIKIVSGGGVQGIATLTNLRIAVGIFSRNGIDMEMRHILSDGTFVTNSTPSLIVSDTIVRII